MATTEIATTTAKIESAEPYSRLAIAHAKMKFSIDGDILADILTKFKGAAIDLTAYATFIVVKAQNEEFTAQVKITEGVNVDYCGDFKLSAKSVKMLKSFLNDARYTFNVADDVLTIRGANSVLDLLKATQQPKLKFGIGGEKVFATIPQCKLKTLLKKTLYATTKDNFHPIFKTVNFKSVDGELILTATDRARLVQATTKRAKMSGELVCNIPAPDLKFVMPLLNKNDAEITFNPEDMNVEISFDDWKVTAKCQAGKFPNCSKVLSLEPLISAEMNTEDIISALNFCKPFADEHNTVNLKFAENFIVISAEKAKVGRVKHTFDARITGEYLALARLNVNWLLETLARLDDSKVTLELSERVITIHEKNSVAVIETFGAIKFNIKSAKVA